MSEAEAWYLWSLPPSFGKDLQSSSVTATSRGGF
jgi:hypothetical protein